MLYQSSLLEFILLFSSIFSIIALKKETKCPVYKSLCKADKNNMNCNIDIIPDSLANMGEGPHWDNASQSLYYNDINDGIILRYSYKENKVYKAKVYGVEGQKEKFASFIIPVEGESDQFAVGCDRRVLIVQWDGISRNATAISTLFEVEKDDNLYGENRFNDAKCDSNGRLFAGTMRYMGDVFVERRGQLYKYDKCLGVKVVKRNVSISNGLTWNDKTKKFYFADTSDFDVKEYGYNVTTGKADINKPRVVLDLHRSNYQHLQPDGMTIDTDGNVYVATFNGSAVFKFNPKNLDYVQKLDVPCLHVTSVAFGGPNNDILFVTTSTQDNLPYPCGSVFKISGLGARGYPMTNIKL